MAEAGFAGSGGPGVRGPLLLLWLATACAGAALVLVGGILLYDPSGGWLALPATPGLATSRAWAFVMIAAGIGLFGWPMPMVIRSARRRI